MTIQALLEAFRANYRQPKYAALPQAPRTGSPVPWLTSLYHDQYAGNYGNRQYPGNCSGNLIRDLLFFFQPQSVFDPMTGGGTCKDVCEQLGIKVVSGDLKSGQDATTYRPEGETFDFVWLHPPYFRMIQYSTDPRDLSAQPTLAEFYGKLLQVMDKAASVLNPGGKIAVLMGDYNDREEGFVCLTQLVKDAARELLLRQACTDIVRFSHGATSSHRRYRSSFIPGLHDVCMIFERKQDVDQETGEISAA
jgi:hypothetical protein